MAITIKTIAKIAGTSRGTVDRVLNHRGNVEPELSKKILEVAKKNNYHSNLIARALVKSKNKCKIGIVIHSVGNEFFDRVLEGIEWAAQEYEKYGVELCIVKIKGYHEEEQIAAVKELLLQNIQALAITPIDTVKVKQLLESLQIPFVALNNNIDAKNMLAFVGCNYEHSGMLCGELASLILPQGGDVAVITGSLHLVGHRNRISGFQRALQAVENVHIVQVLEHDDDEEKSYQVVQNLLHEYPNLSLIYFSAAGVKGGMRAIEQAVNRVKVIAVDETEIVIRCLQQGLIQATVTQQPFEQGVKTIETICNYLLAQIQPEQTNLYTENLVKLKHSFF